MHLFDARYFNAERISRWNNFVFFDTFMSVVNKLDVYRIPIFCLLSILTIFVYFSIFNAGMSINKSLISNMGKNGVHAKTISISLLPTPELVLGDVLIDDKIKASISIEKATVKSNSFKSLLSNLKYAKINLINVTVDDGTNVYSIPKISSNIGFNEDYIHFNQSSVSIFNGSASGDFSYNLKNGIFFGNGGIKNIDLSYFKELDIGILKGVLSGDTKFSCNTSLSNPIESLSLNANLKLIDASVTNSAIAGSLIGLMHGNLSVGNINVKKATAEIKIKKGKIEITKIDADTDSIDGKGNVTIDKNGKLDGTIETRGLMGITGETLYVKGSLDSPIVVPSPTTAAGAIAGTFIAGPIGTVVGAKVGSIIEGALGCHHGNPR